MSTFVDRIVNNHLQYYNDAIQVRKFVIDRRGNTVPFSEDRILNRLIELKRFIETQVGRKLDISISNVWRNFNKSFKDNCSTYEIDQCLAESCAAIRVNADPDYDLFAAQLLINNIVRQLDKHYNVRTFQDYIRLAQSNVNFNTGEPSPLLADDLVEFYHMHAEKIEAKLEETYRSNYLFMYPAVQTMIRGQYFLGIFKNSGERIPIEIPSFMFMRVALGLCQRDIDETLCVYEMMITQLMIPSSPTIFSAGTPQPHLASCFLLGMADDLKKQFETFDKCGQISKHAGGIGVHLQDIRSKGSYIASTNGTSKGIVPIVKTLEQLILYVDQGGKRNGSLAVYLEPHHADFEEFIVMKNLEQSEDTRAHRLNYGLWLSNLFFKRFKEATLAKRQGVDLGIQWSYMNPQVCPGLSDLYGEEYEKKYLEYEEKKMYMKQVPILDVMTKIKYSLSKTGHPYLLNKDEVNLKSNQKNLGTIRSSNLCTEIFEYSLPDETAVCNLFAVNLRNMVKYEGDKLVPDLKLLEEVTATATMVANKVIDKNMYPCEDAKMSNMRNRPIGIGIQGLCTWLQSLGYDIEGKEAAELNREFAEIMLFAAYSESCRLAEEDGHPYETFQGSPLSQGTFHHEMWDTVETSTRLNLDWEGLRARILEHGTKNSLLICHMPTATSSILFDNTPSFELPKYVLYRQVTRNGEFLRWCRPLVLELKKLGLWNDEMYQKLLDSKFGIQDIEEIPEHVRKVFKTDFDLSKDIFLKLARDRAVYVDQGISLNVNFYDVPGRKHINEQLDDYLIACFDYNMKNISYYIKVIQPSEHLKVSSGHTTVRKPMNNSLQRLFSHDQKISQEDQKMSILDIGRNTTGQTNTVVNRRMLLPRRLKMSRAFSTVTKSNVVDDTEECLGCGV